MEQHSLRCLPATLLDIQPSQGERRRDVLGLTRKYSFQQRLCTNVVPQLPAYAGQRKMHFLVLAMASDACLQDH